MTTKEKLIATVGVDDRWALLMLIPVLAFVLPLLFFKETLSNGLIAYIPKFLGSLVHTLGYWLTIRQIIIELRRRFPEQKDTKKRILYSAVLIVIAYVALNPILDVLHTAMGDNGTPGVTEFDYAVASFTVILICVTIYESIFFYVRWKQTIVEAERLRRENVESQLEGLKNQVNPHFLFNSLNTLIYLIPENPQKAVHFVQMLSKVYRYILEIREKKLITLEEELDFLAAYNFLLKERFGDNLYIDLRISELAKNQQIVPLSLQILFENAIKHNIISSDKPLKIEVFTNNGHLVVQNNLQKKKQTIPSTQVGLANIRNRYAFFSNDPVEIFSDDAHFRVSLPLLKTNLPLLQDNA
ncbi:MAG: sensor histidine kinase [Saprospiraceae bacterium]